MYEIRVNARYYLANGQIKVRLDDLRRFSSFNACHKTLIMLQLDPLYLLEYKRRQRSNLLFSLSFYRSLSRLFRAIFKGSQPDVNYNLDKSPKILFNATIFQNDTRESSFRIERSYAICRLDLSGKCK